MLFGTPYAMATLMDVRDMPPGCDGVEATSKIWGIDPDLQVVICTAYSDCSWDEMLNTLGRSDRLVILKKPFDDVEVLQLANSLTRKWQLLRQTRDRAADLERMVDERTTQISREQEKYRSIFRDSPIGIFQTNPEGPLHHRQSGRWPRFTVMPRRRSWPAQLTDISKQLYVDPARRTEFQAVMERDRIVREFESEIQCKDGSRKWILETAIRMANPDGSVRTITRDLCLTSPRAKQPKKNAASPKPSSGTPRSSSPSASSPPASPTKSTRPFSKNRRQHPFHPGMLHRP